MCDLRSTSHAVYEIKYHFVWAPKYRKKVLIPDIQESLKQIFSEIAQEYDFEILEQEMAKDHVHIFVSAPPRYSPATIVNILKSISARETFSRYPQLRRRCWSGKLWEDGYFVRAVGEKITADIIAKYIKHQKKRKTKQLDLF